MVFGLGSIKYGWLIVFGITKHTIHCRRRAMVCEWIHTHTHISHIHIVSGSH